MKQIFLAMLLLLCINCKHESKRDKNKEPKVLNQNLATRNRDVMKLRFNSKITKEHSFSDLHRKDTFKLFYNERNLEDSMVFQINDYKGNLIYLQRLTGMSFYDYNKPSNIYITERRKNKEFKTKILNERIADSLHRADIQYIKMKIDKLFQDEKFTINPLKTLDTRILNQKNCRYFPKDSNLIGFSYCIYDEGFEMIAYSKKKNKVFVIASSD